MAAVDAIDKREASPVSTARMLGVTQFSSFCDVQAVS